MADHSLYSKIARTGCHLLVILLLLGCSPPEPMQSSNAIPTAYLNKHMPEGWWTDQPIIEEGRRIYLGNMKSGVNCADCHGKTGSPVRSGARDFRNAVTMKKYSDSHLLWRISEGVPFSSMPGYKSQLSEDQIWKVIAFVSTLGLKGFHYDPDSGKWIPSE